MIDLSRRSLMTGAATVAGAAALAPLMQTAALAATPTGSGIYRTRVGDIDLIQLQDGARTFPMPDTFVGNASKDQAIAAAAAAYMIDGKITVPFAPILISTGGKLVLIDTGNGLAAYESSKGVVGQATANMLAAGIDPKDINTVVISHFHGDHIGGLKKADGTPAFPNAEIMVPAVEQAFWADDANQSKANGFNKGQFAGNRKMLEGLKLTPYEGGKEIAPGITSVATPGHTPGHTSFVVASGSKRVLVQSGRNQYPGLLPAQSRLDGRLRQ